MLSFYTFKEEKFKRRRCWESVLLNKKLQELNVTKFRKSECCRNVMLETAGMKENLPNNTLNWTKILQFITTILAKTRKQTNCEVKSPKKGLYHTFSRDIFIDKTKRWTINTFKCNFIWRVSYIHAVKNVSHVISRSRLSPHYHSSQLGHSEYICHHSHHHDHQN